MGQIFQTLQDVLIRAIPTFLLVLFLYFYLKSMMFKPLERVLEERRRRTEGALAKSEESLKAAAAKADAYEAAIQQARTEIFKEQEELRRRLLAEQAEQVQKAKERLAEEVDHARRELAGEVESSRRTLALQGETLAELIASRILAARSL